VYDPFSDNPPDESDAPIVEVDDVPGADEPSGRPDLPGTDELLEPELESEPDEPAPPAPPPVKPAPDLDDVEDLMFTDADKLESS
jgi:hypothetical protein